MASNMSKSTSNVPTTKSFSLGTNVAATLDSKGILTLVIDTNKSYGIKAATDKKPAGKMDKIAATDGGFCAIPGVDGATINLYMGRK